jgi:hypothetical protein
MKEMRLRLRSDGNSIKLRLEKSFIGIISVCIINVPMD